MKKIGLLILIVFGWIINAHASHPCGGHITYTHLVDYTYEITVTVYINASSPSGNSFIPINWGDGSPVDSIFSTSDEVLPGNIRKNTFIKTHDFSQPGNYVISTSIPNRNPGILNINYGNSVEVEFYVESRLIIPISNEFNNSIEFLAPVEFDARFFVPFHSNLCATDPDGDLLSYALVPPKNNGGSMEDIYFLPDGLSVNATTGELIWESPDMYGDLVFVIEITECRNGEIVGFVDVDIQFSVSIDAPNSSSFMEMDDWPMDAENNFAITVAPNESVDLSLAYSDNLLNDVQLYAFGEPFNDGNGASFETETEMEGFIRKDFSWTPSIDYLRCAPYLVTFRGNNDISQSATSTDASLLIYVHDETMENCAAACDMLVNTIGEQPDENSYISVFPNPFSTETTIGISIPDNHTFDMLSIYDLSGRKVKTIRVQNQKEITIKRDGLASGVYVFSLEKDSRSIAVKKVVVFD